MYEHAAVQDHAHQVREVRAVLQFRREDEAEDDHHDAVPRVADHEAEEQGEEQEEERGRVDLVVRGRGVQLREELEPPDGAAVLQEDGRRLRLVGLRVPRLCRLHDLRDDTRHRRQGALQVRGPRLGDPPVDHERMVRGREPEGRLRLLDLLLERVLRADDELGVLRPQVRNPFLDLREARGPLLLVCFRRRQECRGVSFARRDLDRGESEASEVRASTVRLVLRDEHRHKTLRGDRLVGGRDRVEAAYVVRDASDEHLEGIVSAVGLEREAEGRERPELRHPPVQVLQQRLDPLPRLVVLAEVEFERGDLLADVHRRGRSLCLLRLFHLEDVRD